MFIGDYWEFADLKWYIVDFDTYKGRYASSDTEHHVLLFPNDCIMRHQMAENETNEHGYFGSAQMHGSSTSACTLIHETILRPILGEEHLIYYRQYLTTSFSQEMGKPSGYIEAELCVAIPTAVEIIGTEYVQGINHRLLPLFRMNQQYLKLPTNEESGNDTGHLDLQYWWLRDECPWDARSFLGVANNTMMSNCPANRQYGVRPTFAMGKRT